MPRECFVNTDGLVYLIHAGAALALLVWLFRQYRWKKEGKRLRGEQREQARSRHEQSGQRTLAALLVVVAAAMLSETWMRLRAGKSVLTVMLPNSLHGAGGLVGVLLFYYLWRRGRDTKQLREEGKSWSLTKRQHGRAADIIIIIGCIHAFLGFLELLKIL